LVRYLKRIIKIGIVMHWMIDYFGYSFGNVVIEEDFLKGWVFKGIIFLEFISLSSCCKHGNILNRYDKLLQVYGSGSIPIMEVFPGNWDQLFIVSGIACEDDIRTLTNLDYHSEKCIQDNEMLIIYVKDSVVAKEELICIRYPYINFDFHHLRLSKNIKLKIHKGESSYQVSLAK